MPQSSYELRQIMIDRYGDIGDGPPANFLESKGWMLTKEWLWRCPHTDYQKIPLDEWEAYVFLIEEWDYGSIKGFAE